MRAVGAGVDQRAGGAGGVIQQRLVPEGRGVVGVERGLRGGERGEAVVIVERVEKADVQDRFDPLAAQVVACLVGAGLPESGGRLPVRRPVRGKTFGRDKISVFGLYHFAIHVKGENIVCPEHLVEKLRDDSQQIQAFFIVALYNKAVLRIEAIFLSILLHVTTTGFRFRNPEILHDFRISPF